MTALDDISNELRQWNPAELARERKRLFVIVGPSAMLSLTAEGGVEPKSIRTPSGTEAYPIIRTDDFPGWAVVAKPVP